MSCLVGYSWRHIFSCCGSFIINNIIPRIYLCFNYLFDILLSFVGCGQILTCSKTGKLFILMASLHTMYTYFPTSLFHVYKISHGFQTSKMTNWDTDQQHHKKIRLIFAARRNSSVLMISAHMKPAAGTCTSGWIQEDWTLSEIVALDDNHTRILINKCYQQESPVKYTVKYNW